MSNDPYAVVTTVATPQTQPVLGRNQVANNAGGYVFQVSDESRLERFLILGTAGGTYYQGERELTAEAAKFLTDYAQSNPDDFLRIVRDVSVNGRAYKQQPTLFALAIACSFGTPESKAAALREVSTICRTGTMLFQFNKYLEQFRGRGRAVNKAVASWYLNRSIGSLQNQLVKYQQREGWSQRDLLRLSKPKPATEAQAAAFAWTVGKPFDPVQVPVIAAFERAKAATMVTEVIAAINDGNLPWEAVPSQWLREPAVWEALLPNLGLTAILRNLGRMSNIGLVTHNSAAAKLVRDRITDPEALISARVHPMQALLARVTYGAGRGVKGELTWTAVPSVVDAIDAAFYMSFGNVPSTGMRRMVALDVSGSMGGAHILNTFLTARQASAALAMVAVRTEDADVYTKGFSDTFMDLGLTKNMTLGEVIKAISNLPFKTTDCSLPMEHAILEKLEIDSFEVYTDSETYAGRRHPFQALQAYRKQSGINAKLVVNGMTATQFTIADPRDAGMLDVVGFDASAPAAISYFITS
jgi:60 kDa SS-A/Ro ribonucleoprotein